jgi:uncharacterized protein with HEPN domain
MDRDQASVEDIVLACREIARFIQTMTRGRFVQDSLVSSGVVRQLEIVGEAVKRLSRSYRDQHPELPWKDMSGMRDRLIHAYDEVDLDLVWHFAHEEIPNVLPLLERLLPPEL